jgi:SAM-dependent methyltransferase
MLPHCKLCDLADFSHPDLLPVLQRVFPHEVARFGPLFPKRVEYRKHWEVAMAVRALEAGGAVRPDAELLGIGVGGEPTVFHLTNHVRRVFATDLYLASGAWAAQAPPHMLTDPGRFWPGAWNPRRLVAQHMNALDLQYEDASFDGIFSSSSLEHFGGPDEIRRAVREMARVLKPGGVLTLATEYRLAGPGPGIPGAHLFTEAELREWILEAADWEPLSPLDLTLGETTRRTVLPFAEGLADVDRHTKQYGALYFHKLDWSRYPHLVLAYGPHVWTSVHVAVRKRGGPAVSTPPAPAAAPG